MKLIADSVGRVRRLVRSKLWRNTVGAVESGSSDAGVGGLRLGVGEAVCISTYDFKRCRHF